MRVLIDNSTFSGALRAIGQIPGSDPSLFDFDVAALRVLIDNIILADEILVLDDYKAEFTSQRKAFFSDGLFHFQPIPEKLQKRFLKDARAHVHNWSLQKNLANEYAEVFDDLSILFRHAWRNSECFLVLKTLGVEDKYGSALTKFLRSQISGLPSGTLEDFSPKAYNRETTRVAQSLAWAAIRTVYYRQASKVTGCEYYSHPLRNMFNIKCILFDNHPLTRKLKLSSRQLNHPDLKGLSKEQLTAAYGLRGTYRFQVNEFFRHFWVDCVQMDETVFGVSTFDVDIPPFFGWVLAQSDTRHGQDIVDRALKLRDDNGVQALRTKLREVYVESSEQELRKRVRDFAAELRDLKDRIQKFLGYDRERVSLKAKLVSYNFTVPRCLTKPLYPHKPHLAWIRDVILELASIGTLGRHLDRLKETNYK